jgi:hypothetical protein
MKRLYSRMFISDCYSYWIMVSCNNEENYCRNKYDTRLKRQKISRVHIDRGLDTYFASGYYLLPYHNRWSSQSTSSIGSPLARALVIKLGNIL